MDIRSFPKHLLEAWTVCEVLRRLGFQADEMTVCFGPAEGMGDNVVQVRLAHGDTEFIIGVMNVVEGPPEEALSQWSDLWEAVRSASNDDLALAMAYSDSSDPARIVGLASAIAARGMEIPALPGLSEGPITLVTGRGFLLSPGGSA